MSNIKNNNLQLLKSSELYYSCPKCNKSPKIVNINYSKNEIILECEEHQSETLKIKDYLSLIIKNQHCQICQKECRDLCQPIKYCISCKLILCNNCALAHISLNHNVIKNEDYNIICKKHLNKYYEAYCKNCKGNICKECKKTGIHYQHNKFDYIEIQPNKNDFEIINNFNKTLKNQIIFLDYNKYIEDLNKEKNDQFNLINKEYQNNKNIIENKYAEHYQKFLNKLNQKKSKELFLLEQKIESLKKDIINEIQKKIDDYEIKRKNTENFKNILDLHNIIINSYKKQGEYNLNYNKNIKIVVDSIKKYKEKSEDQKQNEELKKYGINIDRNLNSIKGKNDLITNEVINKIFDDNYNFSEINISSHNLTSLNFLEKNSGKLKHLLMVDCPINDITILSKINLNALIELKISKAKINDIKALTGTNLKFIKVLNLGNNDISNINILKNVEFKDSLEELYLDNNKIYDISVFNSNNFTNLKILFLSNNTISNISPLKFILINSCQILSLEHNKIQNINLFKDINNFVHLKDLSLRSNQIDTNDENNKKIFEGINAKKINFQF